MAVWDREHSGTGAMEIAFDVSPFCIAGFRNTQPMQTAMMAMSILAMAMVIFLFGGYVDSGNEQRINTAIRTICQTFNHKAEVTKKRSS
jgi:hypothetical protein